MLGGIGSTIAQGLAFGTGSAVAHRDVDSVMGPRTIHHETAGAAAPEAAAANSSFSDKVMRQRDEDLAKEVEYPKQKIPELEQLAKGKGLAGVFNFKATQTQNANLTNPASS